MKKYILTACVVSVAACDARAGPLRRLFARRQPAPAMQFTQPQPMTFAAASTTTTVTTQSESVALSTAGADAMVEAHNRVRAQHGLPPLAFDPSLAAGAAQNSQVQTRRGIGHWLGLGGASAENAAAGQSSAWEAVQSWLRSPGHRANLLGGYRRMGWGVAYGAGGTAYWTVRFGY